MWEPSMPVKMPKSRSIIRGKSKPKLGSKPTPQPAQPAHLSHLARPLLPDLLYLTPEEAAAILRVDRRTLYQWLREGKLVGVKFGSTWRINRNALAMPNVPKVPKIPKNSKV